MATPFNTSKTGSTLLRSDGSNKTSTAISTNILIYVGNHAVGAIQSFQVNENRNIKQIYELGTDGSIDSVPQQSATFNGTCNRIRFDRMKLTEAFGRSFVHVHSQRYPFDIHIIDTWNGDGQDAIITTVKNVWFKSLAYTFSADNWLIQDQAGWEAETMYTTLKGGPSAQGGEINLPLSILSPTSDIERQADTGLLRGALDSPGLLKAFLPF